MCGKKVGACVIGWALSGVAIPILSVSQGKSIPAAVTMVSEFVLSQTKEHVNQRWGRGGRQRGRKGKHSLGVAYVNIDEVCAHMLTDKMGVLMLKWSTHSDRLALLPTSISVIIADTSLHTQRLPLQVCLHFYSPSPLKRVWETQSKRKSWREWSAHVDSYSPIQKFISEIWKENRTGQE